MKGIYFLDYSHKPAVFEYTDDPNYVQVNLCLQEILVWKGECAFDIELGIDYENIFNSSTFLTSQLEEILDKYRKFFKDIAYSIYVEKEQVFISLSFVFLTKSGSYKATLALDHIEQGVEFVSNK